MPEKKIKLNAADVQIIKCLHSDARMAVTSIAETIRVPESTVRHRLGRMLDAGVIEFVAQTNPLNVGYPVWIMMEIQVASPRIRQIAAELADLAEVYFVYITSGQFDIFAGATFRTNEDFVDFLTGPMAKIKGIVRVTTRGILEVYKRQFKFLPTMDGSDRD